MDAKSAVISVAAIKPHPLRDLVKRSPFSPPSIYKAVSELTREGILEVTRGIISIGSGYHARKIAETHIVALTQGIDPGVLLRKSTILIWKNIQGNTTIKQLMKRSGYSHVTVKKCISFLEDSGIITYLKRKPAVVIKNENSKLTDLLDSLTRDEVKNDNFEYPGNIPFREEFLVPEDVEKILFERLDNGISIRGTGFLVKGEEGSITIVESVDEDLSIEDLFLKKLITTEGIEDICIKILGSKEIDMETLSKKAIKSGKASILGCYLDIIDSLGFGINSKIIKELEDNVPDEKLVFLEEERSFGKGEWEDRFEKRWNLDLYLDMDAVRHGVRSA